MIATYETRVQKIQTAFQSSESILESSYSLLDVVHNSLTDLKKERDILNTRLCETLAKNGSLRKKDYNSIMSELIGLLNEKEREAESQFLKFIEDQKYTAHLLRNSILGIKDITSEDNCEKITIIKEQLSQISVLQDSRKKCVLRTFIDFQKMQNRMMECLKTLIEKGDQILIRDIKNIKNKIMKDLVNSQSN